MLLDVTACPQMYGHARVRERIDTGVRGSDLLPATPPDLYCTLRTQRETEGMKCTAGLHLHYA